MAVGIQVLVLGFNYDFLFKHLIEKLLCRKTRLEEMLDNKTIFNVVAKDGIIAESRLKIDELPSDRATILEN